jgi:hypothetical protein
MAACLANALSDSVHIDPNAMDARPRVGSGERKVIICRSPPYQCSSFILHLLSDARHTRASVAKRPGSHRRLLQREGLLRTPSLIEAGELACISRAQDHVAIPVKSQQKKLRNCV